MSLTSDPPRAVMSMIPCPGCGLPRFEEQIGSVPCPVCADGGTPVAAPQAPAKKVAGPDPTAGMPSDVSAMHLATATGGGFAFPAWLGWATVFALGVAAGVGGVLGWQSAFSLTESRVEVAKAEPESQPSLQLPPRRIEVAPMPHEPVPRPAETEPEPESPLLDPKGVLPPPPDQLFVVELNQPDGSYRLPFPMRKGERVVLKGKVKELRVYGLDGGASLDASELEATEVRVTGKVDNRSVLKVKSTGGNVAIDALVTGRSTLQIVAPGGAVTFSPRSTPTRSVTNIDGGSIVNITASVVDVRGDVNGLETKVTTTLPRTGFLKVAAVRGIATVEYRVVGEGKGVPDASATIVSPTANFRKIE